MCPLKCYIVVSLITLLNSIEVMVSGHFHVELGPLWRPGSRVLGGETVPSEELKHRREIVAQQRTCTRSQRGLRQSWHLYASALLAGAACQLPAPPTPHTRCNVSAAVEMIDTTLPKVVKGTRIEHFFSSIETQVKFQYHKPTDLIRKAAYSWPLKMVSW